MSSAAIEGKTNYVQSRSNRLVVYDPAMLAFLLNNKTYRPIIEATKSMKGQQLFVPYIFDIISGRKLGLIKLYPRGSEWTVATDYSGKEIFEFHPRTDEERAFQQSWTEINRIFTHEMLRMQATVLNGRDATEYVMAEKDKISMMSAALKSKSKVEFVAERDLRSASLAMVYFMERDGSTPAVGVVLQEGFPVDPHYKASAKRKLDETEPVVSETKA